MKLFFKTDNNVEKKISVLSALEGNDWYADEAFYRECLALNR